MRQWNSKNVDMNRRNFFRVLALTSVAIALPVEAEALLGGGRRIFLPPRGGWLPSPWDGYSIKIWNPRLAEGPLSLLYGGAVYNFQNLTRAVASLKPGDFLQLESPLPSYHHLDLSGVAGTKLNPIKIKLCARSIHVGIIVCR